MSAAKSGTSCSSSVRVRPTSSTSRWPKAVSQSGIAFTAGTSPAEGASVANSPISVTSARSESCVLEEGDDEMADDPLGAVAGEPAAAQLADLDGELLAIHLADRDHAGLVATLARAVGGAPAASSSSRWLDRPPARGGEATNRRGQQAKVRRTL